MTYYDSCFLAGSYSALEQLARSWAAILENLESLAIFIL